MNIEEYLLLPTVVVTKNIVFCHLEFGRFCFYAYAYATIFFAMVRLRMSVMGASLISFLSWVMRSSAEGRLVFFLHLGRGTKS